MSLPYAFRADGVWGIDLDTPQVLASNLPGKLRSNLYWFRIQSGANPHTKEIAKGKPNAYPTKNSAVRYIDDRMENRVGHDVDLGIEHING